MTRLRARLWRACPVLAFVPILAIELAGGDWQLFVVHSAVTTEVQCRVKLAEARAEIAARFPRFAYRIILEECR